MRPLLQLKSPSRAEFVGHPTLIDFELEGKVVGDIDVGGAS